MNKEKNVVFFGPTNSGKSTLCGYLYSRDMSEKDFEKAVRYFSEEYGSHFDHSKIYSYFVDSAKDEYQKQKGSIGTSKRKHFTQAFLDGVEYTLIDTPGTDTRWKNSFQGIYMGDIGVFVVGSDMLERLVDKVIGSLEYEEYISNMLKPVRLWRKYGRMNQLLFVITKTDLIDHSEYLLRRFEKALRKIDMLKNVPIIPISINVKDRNDINVLPNETNTPYKESFTSSIRKLFLNGDQPIKPLKPETKLASIDKLFKKTKKTKEPAIRIKVIDGSFSVGDSVILGPVKYKNNLMDLNGTIKSLVLEANKRQIAELSENYIGGVMFSRLQHGRDIVDLKEIVIPNTALLRDTESNYSSGNLLVFSIYDDLITSQLWNRQIVNQEFKLIWFGKIEFLRVISFEKRTNGYRLSLINYKGDFPQFRFQKDSQGTIIHTDYVLQFEDSFIGAHLEDVIDVTSSNPKDVVIHLQNDYSAYLKEKGINDSKYSEDEKCTLATIPSATGKIIEKLLFKGEIDKKDILKVAVSKYVRKEY